MPNTSMRFDPGNVALTSCPMKNGKIMKTKTMSLRGMQDLWTHDRHCQERLRCHERGQGGDLRGAQVRNAIQAQSALLAKLCDNEY
jgi:hypothetical protein